MGNKSQNRTHTADYTCGYKFNKPSFAPDGQEPARSERGKVIEKAFCETDCPIPHGAYGYVINQPHGNKEDGQSQNSVGKDTVDFVGKGEPVGMLFLVAIL